MKSLVMEALAVEAPGSDDELGELVVTAALAEFVEYGIRRSTIEGIARRAGASKMTIFRKFQTKQGLVAAVLAREVRRGMEQLDTEWTREETLEESVVHGFRFIVTFVHGHPLFTRLLRSEPEFLLPLMTIDGAPVLALYRDLIAQRLTSEVAAGRAAVDDVHRVAEVIARMAISLVLTRDGVISLDDDNSISEFVHHAVMPMLRLA